MSDIKDQSNTKENNELKEVSTMTNLKTDIEPNINITNENQIKENKDIKNNKQHVTDKSTIALVPNDLDKDAISNLNNPNTSEKKQSFMQKTKSWLGKAWTNFKNSRFNIFKGEEMEECLDAHGFPIKIPKRKHNQNNDKKEEKKNEATTININNK